MKSNNRERVRQKFEEWVMPISSKGGLARFMDMSPNFPGAYKDAVVNNAWLGWRDAYKLAIEDAGGEIQSATSLAEAYAKTLALVNPNRSHQAKVIK